MSNLALLLVLALCMSQPLITNASWFSQRYVVHIENRLSNHTLQTHCRSSDKDLGLQYIPLGGQFQFGFYDSIWDGSYYMCISSWQGGQLTFDAFNSEYYVCEPWHPFTSKSELNCVWRAQDDGLYLLNTVKQKYNLQGTWEH
jgi:hypothetical protein